MAKKTNLMALEKRMNRQEYALAARMIKSSGVKSRAQLLTIDPYTLRNMRAYKASLSAGIYPRGTVMKRLLKLQAFHSLRVVIEGIEKMAGGEAAAGQRATTA